MQTIARNNINVTPNTNYSNTDIVSPIPAISSVSVVSIVSTVSNGPKPSKYNYKSIPRMIGAALNDKNTGSRSSSNSSNFNTQITNVDSGTEIEMQSFTRLAYIDNNITREGDPFLYINDNDNDGDAVEGDNDNINIQIISDIAVNSHTSNTDNDWNSTRLNVNVNDITENQHNQNKDENANENQRMKEKFNDTEMKNENSTILLTKTSTVDNKIWCFSSYYCHINSCLSWY